MTGKQRSEIVKAWKEYDRSLSRLRKLLLPGIDALPSSRTRTSLLKWLKSAETPRLPWARSSPIGQAKEGQPMIAGIYARKSTEQIGVTDEGRGART